MKPLPKISITVPNYNGGKTIARTLQSLVDQNYPDLEIFVMDAASTDDSVQIIKSFEKHLTFWTSEKDRGQSDAINKGFARSTGEILNWLCSDDVLLPGALLSIGNYFAAHPEIDICAGACRFMYTFKNAVEIRRPCAEHLKLLPVLCPIGQPACFYRRRTLDRPEPLRVELQFCMDFELWCHFVRAKRTWGFIDDILAEAIEDGTNKTSTGGMKIVAANERIYREYSNALIPITFWYRHIQMPLRKYMTGSGPTPLRWFAHQFRRAINLGLAPFYGLERLRAMECWYQFFVPEFEPKTPAPLSQQTR